VFLWNDASNATNCFGRAPLDLLFFNTLPQPHVVSFLVNKGAQKHAASMMRIACNAGDVDIVKVLYTVS
jgi:hypothetical protein